MLVKKFEVDIKKIRVIHNGVPVPKVLPNVVRRPDTIGYIGRLDSMKGVNVLIKSADFLKKKQIKVEIAGVGPLDSYLKNLAHDLDNVRFVGRVEPYHFISSVAALVVPSIREPFGNILVEAGACSTPIIASRIDGIPEIITHNKTGLLITPSKPVSIPANLSFGTILPEYVVDPVSMDLVSPLELDPLELAESIFSLLGNQEKCLQLTERNFASVSENFSVEKYVLAVRNVYRSFIR